MAPTAPLGRDGVIALVQEGSLPILFGSPHPTIAVVEQEGRFRIRELVIDQVEAENAAASARRARSPSWMPEHFYALGRPTGHIFAEAKSRADLIEIIRTMSWPDNW
jgi:hypothetical protein